LLDEAARTYAYALLLHVAGENKHVDQEVKYISAARSNCAAWDILCERMDGRSFARSFSMLNNLLLRERPCHSVTEYVHFMRHTFDGYTETCEMIDGSALIHPDNLGLMMLRDISNTEHIGHAKQCVINAFDTNYLMSADEVMDSILHLAHNMDEELLDSALTAHDGPTPSIAAFVAGGRGSHSGRGHGNRGGRGGRGLPNKCSACDSMNHILSS
jgi:hypothetical protein